MKYTVGHLLLICCCIGISVAMHASAIADLEDRVNNVTKSLKPDWEGLSEGLSENVVFVNGASGVIVKSDGRFAYVLTAYHNIEGDCQSGTCSFSDIIINSVGLKIIDNVMMADNEALPVVDVSTGKDCDLAFIKVASSAVYNTITISNKIPMTGMDIMTISNPIMHVRSVKTGIISSTERWSYGVRSMEISSGIIFGSSGGPVFNRNGELIGIINTVAKSPPMCTEKDKKQKRCIRIPVEFMGFAIHTQVVYNFIKESKFAADYFF